MRRSHSSRALVLALALLLAAAVPTVSAASASAAAPAPAAGSPPQSVPTQTGPAANGGPAVSRSVLLVLGAAALVASAGAIRQERRSPRAITHGRVVRRPRREVGARTYRVARRVGFRYSQSRDALVLRAVGNRIGPVLRQRPEPALPHGASPAAAPAPAPSPEPVEHVVDLACLPLPSTKHGRLWQLTAVDADSGYTWAELTRPRGAAPSPEQALAFVQQIEAQLKTRGLQLDAVVVQAGSTHRRVLTSAVEQAGVRVLRTLPR